jgi:protoporphyrinogen oxidase
VRVVVCGAGATGLAAAYLLHRAGHEAIVVEASTQPGGLLATFDAGGGSRLEYFYHHFFTHDAEINWLLDDLGLADRITFLSTSMGVLRGGRLYPFNGLGDLLRFNAVGITARFRFGFGSALLAYRAGYADAEDTPAAAWLDRWCGRAGTDAIWRPLMVSKFGDSAERVPLAWMAGRLRQRARSRKAGGERLGYLTGSLQVLVDRLVDSLTAGGVEVRLSAPVERLLTFDGRVRGVMTPAGDITGDAVLATIPTAVLAPLVRPIDTAFADRLAEIPYLGAICVVLALKEQALPVYWLNVADPGYDFGGMIEQTNFVPNAEYGGRHIVYLSRYLPVSSPLWSLPDADLIAKAVEQLGRVVGRPVSGDLVCGWVFRGRYAAPRTEIGFHRLIPSFRSPVPGLFVASMCHVYPDERSVNNSIRVAAEALRAMGLPCPADAVPRGISLSAKYGPDSPA